MIEFTLIPLKNYLLSVGVKKVILGTGAFAVSYLAYRSLPEPKIRGKLVKVFKSGGLTIKKKRFWMKQETEIFPTIHAVKISLNKTDIVFTIPLGLDPTHVEKKEWLFKQQFGSNIELTRDNNRFYLTIHHHKLPKEVQYDYNLIKPDIQKMAVPIVVGQSKEGFIAYDMNKHPHLLIAGETGSGKSTQNRATISTLISSKPSHQLELFLADMKRSEFHLFRNIEHVKEVVTDTKDLSRLLRNLKKEMQRRGNLLDKHELTHVDELPSKLPYIVLAIDEVALLKKEKEIMSTIEDMSAIGRALGVFLILSMQRPDADVLDGKLKNNLTVRMAFRHSDSINSRITIGSGEAADINPTSKGRMYFKLEGLKEVQGPFLDVEDAKILLSPYKRVETKIESLEEVSEAPLTKEKIFGVLGA